MRRDFGPADTLVAMMQQAGIDIQDTAAVGSFIESFNALPQEEREALLPMSGDLDNSPFAGMPPLPPSPLTSWPARRRRPRCTPGWRGSSRRSGRGWR